MRTVLLTGPTRGIGAAIREELLSHGHRVIGVSRNASQCDAHPKYSSVDLDLSDATSIPEHLKKVDTASIDVVIANAGAPAFGTVEQFSANQISESIGLNLISPMVLLRTLVPTLRANAPGDIVVLGSEAALRGGKKGSVYCAAKFGLRGFTQALREECAPSGVRVTLLNPGMVRTPFFEGLSFRPGPEPEHAIEAQDVARAVSMVLDMRPGTVVDEINLSPLKHVIDFG